MELAPHLSALRTDLAAAAAVGGEDVSTAARLLGDAVEPALRLVLLDLLGEAAAELTEQLDGAAVEVRLQGRDPQLVATMPPMPAMPEPEPEPAADEGEATDEGQARLTLRMPEQLKNRCERAAAGEGISLNSWLVRTVAGVLDGPRGGWPFPGDWPHGGPRGGRRGGPMPPGFPFPPGAPGPRRMTGYGRA